MKEACNSKESLGGIKGIYIFKRNDFKIVNGELKLKRKYGKHTRQHVYYESNMQSM